MEIVTRLLSAGLLFWLAALMALILLRMLRGDHATGFLSSNGGDVAPERVLQMAIVYFVIGKWALDALHAPLDPNNPSLPELPEQLLTIFTSGNALYLAGKITRAQTGAKQ